MVLRWVYLDNPNPNPNWSGGAPGHLVFILYLVTQCYIPAGGAPGLEGGEQMSEACARGTIQLPPDGNPLILLAEHQTTGRSLSGYYHM